jgi:L-alanine-DL-glutamate epimerase-like enolase superfamily enzyme
VRIEGIEAIAIDIPLRRNFGGSTYAVLKRSTIVTRLRTDAGLVSEVYNGDNREHGGELVRLIHEALAPRVKGLSIFEGKRIWEAMWANRPAPKNGMIELSPGPGFGVVLDEAMVRKYRAGQA